MMSTEPVLEEQAESDTIYTTSILPVDYKMSVSIARQDVNDNVQEAAQKEEDGHRRGQQEVNDQDGNSKRTLRHVLEQAPGDLQSHLGLDTVRATEPYLTQNLDLLQELLEGIQGHCDKVRPSPSRCSPTPPHRHATLSTTGSACDSSCRNR